MTHYKITQWILNSLASALWFILFVGVCYLAVKFDKDGTLLNLKGK